MEALWRDRGGAEMSQFFTIISEILNNNNISKPFFGDGHLAWPFTIPHMNSAETDKTDRADIKRQCQCRRRRHSPLARASSILINCRRPHVFLLSSSYIFRVFCSFSALSSLLSAVCCVRFVPVAVRARTWRFFLVSRHRDSDAGMAAGLRDNSVRGRVRWR